MANKNYKVNEVVDVVYQALDGKTGIACTLSVYDETGALDGPQSGSMTEIGVTGRYRKSFTPDAEGLWIVQCDDVKGGKAVKTYSVGTTNVSELGAAIGAVDAKLDDVQTAVNDLQAPPMIG